MIKKVKKSLAVLGPKDTFSDIAAHKYSADAEICYTHDVEEIFELVAKGKVKQGIVPIENKLHGTVRETLDYLFHKKVHVTGEISIPVHHSLVIMPNAKKNDIKHVLSHSQPLSQCKKYLRKNFPKAELQALSSTAAAIEKLLRTRNKCVAVIASEIAAKNSNLKTFAKNIEDEKGNETTFVVVEKGDYKPLKSDQKNSTKTSIAFHFSADAPGSLFSVLKIFADARINLTKIESRPIQKKFKDYIFYLDFEGLPKKSILKKVGKQVRALKILGSY